MNAERIGQEENEQDLVVVDPAYAPVTMPQPIGIVQWLGAQPPALLIASAIIIAAFIARR